MMDDSQKLHQLTENIHENLLQNFTPGLKQFISAGRAYQRALQNASQCARVYIESLVKLAQSAQICKGATSDIGAALIQIAEVLKEIQTQVNDNLKAFQSDLLLPLESKQENDFKNIAGEQKKYATGNKYHYQALLKAREGLKKVQKKGRMKGMMEPKEIQQLQLVGDRQAKLDEFRIDGAKLALLEQRKRYCFLLDKICITARNQAAHHNKANELLTHRLQDWSELCRKPNVLPEASEVLLHISYDNEDQFFQQENSDQLRRRSIDFDRMAPDGGSQTTYPSGTNQRPEFNGNVNRQDNGQPNYPGYGTGWTEHVGAATLPRTITVPSPVAAQGKPQVRAMYTHIANGDHQLSFTEGDIITLVGDRKDGWHYGENTRSGRYGWFPISFTETLDPNEEPNPHPHAQRFKSMGDITETPDRRQMSGPTQNSLDVHSHKPTAATSPGHRPQHPQLGANDWSTGPDVRANSPYHPTPPHQRPPYPRENYGMTRLSPDNPDVEFRQKSMPDIRMTEDYRRQPTDPQPPPPPPLPGQNSHFSPISRDNRRSVMPPAMEHSESDGSLETYSRPQPARQSIYQAPPPPPPPPPPGGSKRNSYAPPIQTTHSNLNHLMNGQHEQKNDPRMERDSRMDRDPRDPRGYPMMPNDPHAYHDQGYGDQGGVYSNIPQSRSYGSDEGQSSYLSRRTLQMGQAGPPGTQMGHPGHQGPQMGQHGPQHMVPPQRDQQYRQNYRQDNGPMHPAADYNDDEEPRDNPFAAQKNRLRKSVINDRSAPIIK
ncbi:brain-specific angiogenesis inhibitor 1-associated protein 2-like isoform X2 [Lineus longissimus]|uniref:brain-specific angiogenesis inhibitor 1-associated protein 2-like isoform X2 n=1 Tax=Lineus longissimus TaxID=88925 RepID=UPI00315CAB43